MGRRAEHHMLGSYENTLMSLFNFTMKSNHEFNSWNFFIFSFREGHGYSNPVFMKPKAKCLFSVGDPPYLASAYHNKNNTAFQMLQSDLGTRCNYKNFVVLNFLQM